MLGTRLPDPGASRDDINGLCRSVSPVGRPLPGWSARPAPPRTPMQGRFCRSSRSTRTGTRADLFAANSARRRGRNWTYLSDGPFDDLADYRAWLEQVRPADDPLFHAIVDRATGKAVGVATYHAHRARARRDRGRQHHLFAAAAADARRHRGHVPDDARACSTNSATAATSGSAMRSTPVSRAAALRLGFSYEGVFRQAVVYKGRNRDTAWFSIIDSEWPALKRAYGEWLAEGNFDAEGGRSNPGLGGGRL